MYQKRPRSELRRIQGMKHPTEEVSHRKHRRTLSNCEPRRPMQSYIIPNLATNGFERAEVNMDPLLIQLDDWMSVEALTPDEDLDIPILVRFDTSHVGSERPSAPPKRASNVQITPRCIRSELRRRQAEWVTKTESWT